MPVALAPSFVFPTVESGPMTTEAMASYTDPKAVAPLASPRGYRGGTVVPTEAGILSGPPSVLAQLASLTARIEALSAPAPVAKVEEAPAEPTRLPPWGLPHYDSCAAFAGEASRVKASGRLAFGSDKQKMAL